MGSRFYNIMLLKALQHILLKCSFLFKGEAANMSETKATIEAKRETIESSAGEQAVYDQCGSDLKKHIYLEHSEDQGTSENQSTFKTEPDWTQQQQLEQEEQKPLICEICNFSHQFEYQLMKHLQTVHETMKPYKCDICPLAFGQRWKLAKHKLYVHDKYRPFECHLCERGAASKHDLNNHIKLVHEKVKDFSCEKCGKCVGTKGSLRKHCFLMHSNLIAHIPCTECGKLFRTRRNEREHFQIVHSNIRNFKCEFCEMKFQNGSICKQHMKRRHKNVHIKQNTIGKDAARSKREMNKQRAQNNRSLSPTSGVKSTFKWENKVKTEHDKVSSHDNLKNLLNFESNMDVLGDVLNEFNMTEDLGETLKHIRNINYSKQETNISKPKFINKLKVQPKIQRETKLFDEEDGYSENLKLTTRDSVVQPEYADSEFDTNHTGDASTPNNTLTVGEAKNQSQSRITTSTSLTESWSNLLEIYSSSTRKEPITNQEWVQVEQFLIEQLTTEISTGVISALQVKILDSGFDKSKMMGIIHVKDDGSKEWYKQKLANFSLDGKCFRAWAKNEEPEVYQLRLILPSKLNSMSETLVMKMLGSFNPQLNTSQLKVNQFEKIENEGRRVHLEVDKETFQLIEDQDWKLDFVLGELDCLNAKNQ